MKQAANHVMMVYKGASPRDPTHPPLVAHTCSATSSYTEQMTDPASVHRRADVCSQSGGNRGLYFWVESGAEAEYIA
jgi:hypothetical protein